VVGGGVWRAYARGVFSVGEGSAFEPWKDWKVGQNGPLALVRAAILAASPHNSQPWLFKVSNTRVELYANTERKSGALDPYLREQHIGLGCALENMMVAAAAHGYTATATLLPGKLAPIPYDPKRQLVAQVNLAPGQQQKSALYDAIPDRHTNRNPYYLTVLPSDFINGVRELAAGEQDVRVFLFIADTDRTRIVDMISNANNVLYADPQVNQGSDKWVRRQWNDVQKFRDGLIVDQAGNAPLESAIMKFTPRPLLRFSFRHGLLRTMSYREVLHATPLFGTIAVRDRYDQEQNLRAGRIWQRAHLLATTYHVAGRPVNEAVELVDYQRLHTQELADAALSELIGDKNNIC